MSADGTWDTLQWKRRLEVFERQIESSNSDDPTLAKGSRGEIDAVCQPGELTDRGRQTTTALGQRLRDLYVSKLGLLPDVIDAATASSIYLRSTPMPRAQESAQQTFTGLYPVTKRSADFELPVMVSRSFADETLFPNEEGCKRFAELSRIVPLKSGTHRPSLHTSTRRSANGCRPIPLWSELILTLD